MITENEWLHVVCMDESPDTVKVMASFFTVPPNKRSPILY